MSSPTNINLNDTVPPPKPDAFNAEVQAGAPYPDPNVPGAVVRDASLCYRTPQVGGVLVLTDVYDLGGPDAGFTFVCNSATPFTITHPAVIPVLPNPQGIWNFKLINLGAGTVTVDLNGLNLDGSGTNPTYATGEGAEISTDGTDLYTCLSSGTGGGGSGTVTSVGLSTDASFLTVGSSPVTTAGTITLNKTAALTGNQVVATPDGTTGKADLRALVAADIPNLPASKITTGQLALARGGTGVDLSASGGTTKVLAQDASHVISARDLIAADVPNIAESQVTSLVSDLALKAPLASPALTGTPSAPTAAVDTNTTQVATTGFVIGQAASATPLVESGSGAVGTSTRFARGDHAHPASTPLTTKGDIYTRSGSADARQAVGADGTVPVADSAQSNGWTWKSFSSILGIGQGILFADYADAGNVTTGETDLYSDSIAGGTLSSSGSAICARYAGTLANTASTKTLRVYFGGTKIFDSGALTSTAVGNWDVSLMLISDGSNIRATVRLDITGASGTGSATYTTVSALTLSSAQILKITGQAGGSGPASNDIIAKEGLGWLPSGSLQLVIGFIISDGTIGNGVGPILAAPHSGKVTVCKIIVNNSDPSISLQIKIRKNGTDVFSADPSVSAGSTQGTIVTTTLLTSNPLSVSQDDKFTIDIVNGSSLWKFTAQLET